MLMIQQREIIDFFRALFYFFLLLSIYFIKVQFIIQNLVIVTPAYILYFLFANLFNLVLLL